MKSKCPWCGSLRHDKRIDGYIRFICGSSLLKEEYKWQSDNCKMKCYEAQLARLRELLGVALRRFKLIDAGVRFTHHESIIAKFTAELKELKP